MAYNPDSLNNVTAKRIAFAKKHGYIYIGKGWFRYDGIKDSTPEASSIPVATPKDDEERWYNKL